jgi:DNA-binding CsgD family transcriptional regulator
METLISNGAIALTPREVEVLRLLAAGCSYWQAAMRLGISPHTVVSHVKNAYRKLDVHNAPAAVMRAIELGLLRAGALS